MKREKEKIIFTWSGGKDSAMALFKLLQGGRYEIVSLLTTLSSEYDRISMHGVRRELLKMQAESLGISLREVFVTKNGSNREYEARMAEAMLAFKRQGIKNVAFGDIFQSFVYDGPIFKKRIAFKKGERILRDNRFSFCDLIPEEVNA
jgi:diphthamide synthase (EF-2-diphthine--ammonia ligase)